MDNACARLLPRQHDHFSLLAPGVQLFTPAAATQPPFCAGGKNKILCA